MNKIKASINKKLREIESKEKIKILFAAESGSRAWGFESKDSDYDVRFIYVHALDWYLSIEEKRDVIEYPIFDNLDISGWDIKKALKLFKNSNPPLYEWLNSPIIYMEDEDFGQRLRILMPKFYSPVSSLNHYLHMAQRNYKAYLRTEHVKIKKYFYVLRPIFACMWIEREKSIPPMEFERLFKSEKSSLKISKEIRELLKRKREGFELKEESRIKVIDDFLVEKLSYFGNYSRTLKVKRHFEARLLDNLFREQVIHSSK